ncbi:HPr kinase/phosphorylase [Paracoccus tegillarcae]|uniref:Serine kinase n=1 Tax=Paracoccus tegillarcae TaxID=1529068 RepID=A0A2K9EGL2_9RHOB|nr:serine kinase [Paracoccus tegillarcae]AUH32467.1 serine kinase [Paracoccus tegillarcae]
MSADSGRRVRGSSVLLAGQGVLITGSSGAGKSSLALDLMAMGAELISDDWTLVRRNGSELLAEAPDAIRGQIEARGIGILSAEPAGPATLALVVQLGDHDDQRLPPFRVTEIAGVSLPLVKATYRPHLGAALRQLLIGGRRA